jgi:hypothetical protein
MGKRTASRGDTLAHNMSFHVTNSICGKEKCAAFFIRLLYFHKPSHFIFQCAAAKLLKGF